MQSTHICYINNEFAGNQNYYFSLKFKRLSVKTNKNLKMSKRGHQCPLSGLLGIDNMPRCAHSCLSID